MALLVKTKTGGLATVKTTSVWDKDVGFSVCFHLFGKNVFATTSQTSANMIFKTHECLVSECPTCDCHCGVHFVIITAIGRLYLTAARVRATARTQTAEQSNGSAAHVPLFCSANKRQHAGDHNFKKMLCRPRKELASDCSVLSDAHCSPKILKLSTPQGKLPGRTLSEPLSSE